MTNNEMIDTFANGVIEGCHFNVKVTSGVAMAGLICPFPGVRQALLGAAVGGATSTAVLFLAAHAAKYIVAPPRLGDDTDDVSDFVARMLRYRVAKGV